MKEHLTYDEYFDIYNKPTLIYKNYFEQQQEIDRLNNIINKLDEYLHKMEDSAGGKYYEAIQDTIYFLNMLKEYKGD